MKSDIKNIEASVKARLQNKAKETNRPFAEVLQSDQEIMWKTFLRKRQIKSAPSSLRDVALEIEKFLAKSMKIE